MTTLARRRTFLLLPVVCVLLSVVFLNTSEAQLPNVLSYDGYLTDANGKPLTSGRKDFAFSLYTTPTGGTPIWVEVHEKVLVNNGAFHVVLGRGTVPKPLDIPFDQQYYLGVRVGSDPEMVPRQELMPSAYSFRAKTAESVPDTSITTEKLKSHSITDDKIKSVSWSKITGGNEGVSARVWSRQGNNNTDPNTDFLGTGDEQDLIFRTNNLQRMVLYSGGNVDINSHLLTLGSITSRASATEGAFYLGDNNFGLRRIGGGNNVELFSTAGNLFLTGGNVGIGTLNPSERLHVAGNALLSGNLNASGSGLFGGEMRVNGLTTLNNANVLGNLNAAGSFTVSGTGDFANLNVLNNANIGHDLFVNRLAVRFDTTHAISSRAQLEVVGNVSGPSDFISNYVAVLYNASEGSDTHGLAIQLKGLGGNSGDKVDHSNNFVTFFNGTRHEISGRIEGETVGENLLQPDYLNEGITLGVKTVIWVAFSWKEWAAFLAGIADIVSFGVKTGIRVAGAGVTYASGAGDYAESLQRLNENERIAPGDVVGVFGGKISRRTKGAERIMAVSTNPIVLGNIPQKNQEYLYEKVAFLGQVPVGVVGEVAEGDYIIPSGREDGTAIAVAPKLMTSAEFPKVLGRAWGSSRISYKKLVNVAIGLSAGDIAPIVNRAEARLAELKKQLDLNAATLVEAQTRLQSLESRVSDLGVLHDEVAQLKALVTGLRQASDALPASSSQRAFTPVVYK